MSYLGFMLHSTSSPPKLVVEQVAEKSWASAVTGVTSLGISPRTAHATKDPLGLEPHLREENHIPRLSTGPPSPDVALADVGRREQKSISLELMFVVIVVLKDRRLHRRAPWILRRPLQHLLPLPSPLVDWHLWTHTMVEDFTFIMGYLWGSLLK
jgi:hypothetical protein